MVLQLTNPTHPPPLKVKGKHLSAVDPFIWDHFGKAEASHKYRSWTGDYSAQPRGTPTNFFFFLATYNKTLHAMKRGEKHAKGQKVKVQWWVAHLTFSSDAAGAFCFLEAMFGNLAVLIEFYFFPFVLINSHNKMNRRSALRQLPNTLCKVWAIKVSLTAGTLLRVTDKVRISGSASHIWTRFKDKANLNEFN